MDLHLLPFIKELDLKKYKNHENVYIKLVSSFIYFISQREYNMDCISYELGYLGDENEIDIIKTLTENNGKKLNKYQIIRGLINGKHGKLLISYLDNYDTQELLPILYEMEYSNFNEHDNNISNEYDISEIYNFVMNNYIKTCSYEHNDTLNQVLLTANCQSGRLKNENVKKKIKSANPDIICSWCNHTLSKH